MCIEYDDVKDDNVEVGRDRHTHAQTYKTDDR